MDRPPLDGTNFGNRMTGKFLSRRWLLSEFCHALSLAPKTGGAAAIVPRAPRHREINLKQGGWIGGVPRREL